MSPREYVRTELRRAGIDPDRDAGCRKRSVVAVKVYIARRLRDEGESYGNIARAFGGVHHTTVMNWLGKFPLKRKGPMPTEIESCSTWSDGKHQFVVEVRGEFETTQTIVKACACGRQVGQREKENIEHVDSSD